MDGSEIHEAVLTLLALDRAGAEVTCLAPNIAQEGVMDHSKSERAKESRNALVESARIARGKITGIAQVSALEFDAIALPGGYGAAKNLSNFAAVGAGATVEASTKKFLVEAWRAKKPIGAWCIAPATVAAALREEKARPSLTIGNDLVTAKALESMGAKHVQCRVDEICVDETNLIVTTPAYMFDARIADVARGIDKAVQALIAMAR